MTADRIPNLDALPHNADWIKLAHIGRRRRRTPAELAERIATALEARMFASRPDAFDERLLRACAEYLAAAAAAGALDVPRS